MKTLLTLILLLTAIPAYAYDFYNVEVTKVYDGDTITVTLPYVHPLLGKKLGIRIYGIDTPEIRGKCDREKEMALIAKKEVLSAIRINGYKVNLKNCSRGKYFRAVCEVWTGSNLADDLIHKNLAYPYFGETKQGWCDE